MFGLNIFLHDPPTKTKQKISNLKKTLKEKINTPVCKLSYIRLRDF